MFHTSAGVATTNCCIESFNKIVKDVYTKGQVKIVLNFLLVVMQKIINQYSYQPKDFCLYREPDYDTIKEANLICDGPIPFLEVGQAGQGLYSFDNNYSLGVQDNVTYPGFKFIYCSCLFYNKWYHCKHTIALAIRLNLKLKGFELKKLLPSNAKKGRTPRAAKALEREPAAGLPPQVPRVRPYLKKIEHSLYIYKLYFYFK